VTPPRLTAARAVAGIAAGSRIWVGSGCAAPVRLALALLGDAATRPPDLSVMSFLGTGLPAPTGAGAWRQRSFFMPADLAGHAAIDGTDYVPIALADVPRLLANGRLPVDVALLQVSPPDARGYVSLGVSVELAPAVLAGGCRAIGEIVPRMPRTHGDSMLPAARFESLVDTDDAVIEYTQPAADLAIAQAVGRYIASIIDDGATLHLGLGRLPEAALAWLGDRRDLGFHGEVLTDGVAELAARGVLTGARKTHARWRAIATHAFGTRRLYDWLDDNPGLALRAVERVADQALIAGQHRMVAITQAFAIDLTGQVCIEAEAGRAYGGIATQPTFLRGAARSTGGKAIICLASTDAQGTASRIQAALAPDQPVGIARADVHHVVTEYGIAYLFGRSLRERALALIEIAHPRFRDDLLRAAIAAGHLRAGQTLASAGPYPVAAERRVQLADGAVVLIRPTRAGDAPALQHLFHAMTEEDRYTRFFHRMRRLSDTEAERLCNVDHTHDVAFLAVTGEREAETVVGSACYFLDPTTNLAEVAYIVAPAFQGRGLGSALQRVLVAYARAQGVRGLVAEILPGNSRMRRLAERGEGTVSVASDQDGTRVTLLFH
jgi:acyl-CoA hydrolase/RimJ/RimL family protein N-acetyltransferase